MKADLVSLVEAAYRDDHDVERWLANLVLAVHATVGARGVFGVVVGRYPAGESWARQEVQRALVSERPVLAASHCGAPERRPGIAPPFKLRVTDALGTELVLEILRDRPGPVPAARRLLLSYVASHVKTAYRLRGERLDLRETGSERDTLFSMSDGLGPVCGAAARHDSRETLRAMARACARIDRCADARRRRAALVAWRALFGGHWSVVDHWDEDGLTTLVAHRNEPTAPQAKGLTAREGVIVSLAAQGWSNKEIRYELDCPLSTIASCLTSAILKLGVSSRTALVRMLAPGEGAAIRRRGEEVVCGASAEAGARLVGLQPRIPEAPANLDAATFRIASEDFLALTFSATAAGLAVLTESEQQVASELLRGRSYRDIAQIRGTSPSTIASQVQSIFRKLKVRSRTELATTASCAETVSQGQA
jgi:DNA-binding NarL/FixJ family response regulator